MSWVQWVSLVFKIKFRPLNMIYRGLQYLVSMLFFPQKERPFFSRQILYMLCYRITCLRKTLENFNIKISLPCSLFLSSPSLFISSLFLPSFLSDRLVFIFNLSALTKTKPRNSFPKILALQKTYGVLGFAFLLYFQFRWIQ